MPKKIKTPQKKKSIRVAKKSNKLAPARALQRKLSSKKLQKINKSVARNVVLRAVAKKVLKTTKLPLKGKRSADPSTSGPKPFKKPRIKEETEEPQPELKPREELNKEEVSRILGESYARHVIIEAAGEHALEIVRHFSNNSSDEDISKKLKIKISDVRAALNKLHSLGIVEYSRQKNSETGWFHYFWSLNLDKMNRWVENKMNEENRSNEYKDGEYYFCPRCGGASIYEFVSASDMGFKCPSCSTALDFLSQEKTRELFPVRSFRKPTL